MREQGNVAMKSMEWASLQDIDDVPPINGSDSECLKELYRTLQRFGMERRFGITLLHKHFELSDDEILLERTDVENRTLTLTPAKRASIEVTSGTSTSWMLVSDDETVVNTICYRQCFRDAQVGHKPGPHERS